MDKAELARYVTGACRLEGEFTLRSGATSNVYFDKYLFESDPNLLKEATKLLINLIPEDTDVLAGIELGGIPITTALSLYTGLPACFVRKIAKPYGTAKLAEGIEINNRKLLIIEDVVTTGGQVVESTKRLRKRGAKIDTVLCVIDRRLANSSLQLLDEAGLKLLSLFTREDLGWHSAVQ